MTLQFPVTNMTNPAIKTCEVDTKLAGVGFKFFKLAVVTLMTLLLMWSYTTQHLETDDRRHRQYKPIAINMPNDKARTMSDKVNISDHTEEYHSSNCPGSLNYTENLVVNDTAAQIVALVLRLTSIKRADVIALLDSTLRNAAPQLAFLLDVLQDFDTQHACEACHDTRPPPRPVLDARIRLDHNVSWMGLSLPALAMNPLGRLGNQMGEYATLFAFKKIYNTTVVLIPTESALDASFAGLSIPHLKKFNHSAWRPVYRDDAGLYTYHATHLAAAGLLGPHLFLLMDYPFEAAVFGAYKTELIKEFSFNETVMRQAEARLEIARGIATNATSGQGDPQVLVGVHVRLTDYPDYVRKKFALKDIQAQYEGYLKRATNFFLRRHANVVFVVTSDDIKSTTKIFLKLGVNTTYISQGSAVEDMCMLTLCHHHIITLGTYGFWTGFLGPGITIYPQLDPDSGYPFTKSFYGAAGLANFIPMPFS
ncbi:galactoside alpha-(1,2)-fucosyltransferase 2 [Hyalella azteca]|uniref:L-Fucosyltransferase n=1 Tax=Hyalella azteca TaxID=294128 RepID=A0A8B7P2E6_HYAAZ|nr:galactoside alpha-(1,2)-fucosyltransferase 2 [Hyalella azteca]